MANIESLYRKDCLIQFKDIKSRVERVLAQINDHEWHWQPNGESNSIAIIMKHLIGNIQSRWTDFLTTDGEKPSRDRDGEFIDDITSRKALMQEWEQAWEILFHEIEGLANEDLLRTVTIREEPMTVMEAIQRSLIHFSNHLGQIIYIGKQLKDKDWQTLSIPRGQSKTYKPGQK